MSVLICNDCGNDMGDVNLDKCTECQPSNLSRQLFLSDHVPVAESIKGKSNKMPGKKKPFSEFQAGDEWSVSKEKFVVLDIEDYEKDRAEKKLLMRLQEAKRL